MQDSRSLARATLGAVGVVYGDIGTAVFLVSHRGFVPTALLRNLEHNHVCHQRIVILHLEVERTPRRDVINRAWPEEIHQGIWIINAKFGFMETLDVNAALAGFKARLFAWMQRRSAQAAEFFRMPTRNVVVLATEIAI